MAEAGNHYTVLARRFRPQAFGDVIGQEHIAQALMNAIRTGRVAHAYMFSGARGVGKTSTARILAKALNCPDVVDGVPCNTCEICDGISAGNDVDVLEIDGASNRRIDDIRLIRTTVGVRSMRSRYKVYIIDEVHMLTTEAFNALLKTLEEPPPNVKFVFCTTEPNKVPDTILSRCQRFDFSAIADGSIADRLRHIAVAEGFTVAEDALELVARRARGSMRDSQSLFDQLLAFSDGEVTSDDVHRMLGTAGDERMIDLFQAIVEHRPGEVMTQVDAAVSFGVQPGEFMDQAISYCRDLLLTLAAGDQVSLASVASRHRPTLLEQARRVGMPSVMAAFQILAKAKDQMFRNTFSRTVLEMAFVQISLLENLTALSDLLSGRLPALTDVSLDARGAAPAASHTTEKKNLTLPDDHAPVAPEVPHEAAPAVDRQSSSLQRPGKIASDDGGTAVAATVQVTQPEPQVQLVTGKNPVLLDSLLQTENARFASSLRQAESLEFTPPGRIEIRIGRSRDFARRLLEQPDHRSAIEGRIRELTGQSVTVSTLSFADETPQPVAPEQNGHATEAQARRPQPASRDDVRVPVKDLKGEVDPARDPFVKKVMDAFGGTVVRITAAPVISSVEPDDN